jgi:hypothetical protein
VDRCATYPINENTDEDEEVPIVVFEEKSSDEEDINEFNKENLHTAATINKMTSFVEKEPLLVALKKPVKQ